MTIRLAVIDDQELMRTGFSMILNAVPDFEVVGEGSDGTDAVPVCRSTQPDVLLLDIRMPECDGIEATRRLAAATDISTKVLILTTFDLDDYVYDAVRAGASGFLLKDTPAEQLVEAVRVIADGDSLLSPSVTRKLLEAFVDQPPEDQSPEDKPFEVPVELAELSDREVEVLRLLAEGLSNAEIADRLFLSATTVKSHVSNVLHKLAVRDRLQAVVLAYQSGLVRPQCQ